MRHFITYLQSLSIFGQLVGSETDNSSLSDQVVASTCLCFAKSSYSVPLIMSFNFAKPSAACGLMPYPNEPRYIKATLSQNTPV
jgi:hypothetical protein